MKATRSFALALVLTVPIASGLVSPTPALAQEEAAPGESTNSGRPFDGYFLMGGFTLGALFLVGKSARR